MMVVDQDLFTKFTEHHFTKNQIQMGRNKIQQMEACGDLIFLHDKNPDQMCFMKPKCNTIYTPNWFLV